MRWVSQLKVIRLVGGKPLNWVESLNWRRLLWLEASAWVKGESSPPFPDVSWAACMSHINQMTLETSKCHPVMKLDHLVRKKCAWNLMQLMMIFVGTTLTSFITRVLMEALKLLAIVTPSSGYVAQSYHSYKGPWYIFYEILFPSILELPFCFLGENLQTRESFGL